MDLVADGSALRGHAVRDGVLVRTLEALAFAHAADGATTLLQAAAAYRRLAADARAMAVAGGQLVSADDGIVDVAYPATEPGGPTALGSFRAADGTCLAYREVGDGPVVVCLPGGPMQDARYLGSLGGLSAQHRLVLLDPRGTGASAVPIDPTSYRCDRQVADVESLRVHLGQERMTLLGHSAGANLAIGDAARHPDRVERLLLITPGVACTGIDVSPSARREVADLRADHAAAQQQRNDTAAAVFGSEAPSTRSPLARGWPRSPCRCWWSPARST